MKTTSHVELDARANAVLERFFDRTGWAPVDNEKPGDRVLDKPFDQWLQGADDGSGEEVGDYELRQRMLGVKTFFEYLASKGVHPFCMVRWLVVIGRALHVSPFAELTMHEAGALMDETPAAHSYRGKVLTGEIKLAGFRATRLPGQKTPAAVASYKVCRKGNCNRKGGKKEEARRARDARRLNGQATTFAGVVPASNQDKK